jgi:hypothetical protein
MCKESAVLNPCSCFSIYFSVLFFWRHSANGDTIIHTFCSYYYRFIAASNHIPAIYFARRISSRLIHPLLSIHRLTARTDQSDYIWIYYLSKTIAGFVVGYFFNENTVEQTLGSYRYVLLIGLCSIIQDLVYFIIFFQGTEGSIIFSVLQMTLGMTLYTCVIGVLAMFFFSRKYNISWAQWSTQRRLTSYHVGEY